MPSKGVDYYLYFGSDDFNANVAVPKIDRRHGREVNFQRNNMQVQSSNIRGIFNYTGRLEWVARRGGTEATRQWQDISSLTGNLGGGTMKNMFNTPPRVGDPTVCWGFYDSGNGSTGLSNQHQLYAYVTRDQRNWMGELARRNPAVAKAPFARFALPGAHDAGMFDMTAVMKVLNTPALYAALIASFALIPIIGPVIAAAGGIGRAFAPRAIANLSMTQKDNVRAMLDIGTRYFDFRPGIMHPTLRAFTPGVRYHQHAAIPGQPYVDFLTDVLRWLDANPGEIVVVSANTQGVPMEMRPSAADVQKDYEDARDRARLSKPIPIGDKRHLAQSYDDLIRSNTRLIFLNQIAGESRKYDSYNVIPGNYATLKPDPIIRSFEAMKPTMPDGEDYIVMQMQATATSVTSVIMPAVLTESDAHSPLLATKAAVDNATNPWLRAHAAQRLSHDHLLVLLNDFVDNCMVETAIQVTEQRVTRA